MRRIRRAARPLIAGVLVLGVSLILTPLAIEVWTVKMIPAADRIHFGDLLTPALLLAGLGLYGAVSALTVRRGRGRSLPGRVAARAPSGGHR